MLSLANSIVVAVSKAQLRYEMWVWSLSGKLERLRFFGSTPSYRYSGLTKPTSVTPRHFVIHGHSNSKTHQRVAIRSARIIAVFHVLTLDGNFHWSARKGITVEIIEVPMAMLYALKCTYAITYGYLSCTFFPLITWHCTGFRIWEVFVTDMDD